MSSKSPPNLCIPSRPGVFPVGIFGVLFWLNKVYFHLRIFFEYLQLFLSIGFFVKIFPFPYFAPKSFCLSCIRLLVCLRPFFPNLRVAFFFRSFVMSCFVYIVWFGVKYLFNLPSFASIFGFISWSYILRSNCFDFIASSEHTFSCSSISVFLLVVMDFLSVFSIWFPIRVLTFCLCSSEEPRFHHRLI